MTTSLPLFPLNTILFPHARLPLRIFESRYIDMVRECMRNDIGFGVVWRMDIAPGQPSGHARVGTEAVITDFSTLEDGLLGIECRGRRRFIVRGSRARHDGLIIGDLDWIEDEPAGAVQPQHATLQTLMREILNQPELASLDHVDPDNDVSLGFGLASILPIDPARAQNLLELDGADQRLDALLGIVESLSRESEPRR
ncbi:MAG: LON peptidase substrate-binding domain-containing protein [Wenzhouxiangella sp.]|jgi:Lon protease-like protein|nr:LON peptidase substrate-binding domain-containing protein [Wenzhouxiangella sp.]